MAPALRVTDGNGELIGRDVGRVVDPQVLTTFPSGPISTLLKFQRGVKPVCSFTAR